jgi:MFS transporter, OFA family, oxalate/formate antiporter
LKHPTFRRQTARALSTTPQLTSKLIDRSPVHYGWVVLGASTVGMAMTIPGQTVGVSVFLDAIIEDLGLGRSAVSGAYTFGTLAASLSLPFIGRHIDRFGPRRAVVIIASLFAFACAFMGLVAGFITLLIGFTLLRGLGQGALSLVSVHSINIWFVQRRGMAVGLAGLGFAAATATLPVGFDWLMEGVGWRWSYAILGVVVLAVMVPVGGGLFRDRPELYGLLPDRATRDESERPEIETHYRLDEARRTLTFWLYVVGGFITAAFGTGLVFHHFSIVGESGVGRPAAALMFVGYGIVAALATLITGFLIDRIPPRFLLAVTLGLMGAAMLSATSVATTAAVIGYGVVLGGMQGMNQAIQSTVYGHYFGRLHFGSIKGMATTIMVAGTAAGPLLLAFGFDISGSYQPVLWMAAAIPLLLAAVAPFLPLMRDGRVL